MWVPLGKGYHRMASAFRSQSLSVEGARSVTREAEITYFFSPAALMCFQFLWI